MITVGIIMWVVMGVIFALALWGATHEDKVARIVLFVLEILIFGILVCWYSFCAVDRYKQGQVDALTGKVEYQLVTKPDSTRMWEKIEEGGEGDPDH